MSITTRHAKQGDRVWIQRAPTGRVRWIDFDDDSIEVLLDRGTRLEGIVGQHVLTIEIETYGKWTIIDPEGLAVDPAAYHESEFLVTSLPS